MPFMRGIAPIRATKKYLESGKIVLRPAVKVLTINYNTREDNHAGTREFVFWHLPQVQYKNPSVQIVTFKNLTPTPFIRCYLDSGKQVLIDVDGKTKEEIHNRLQRILGKSEATLAAEEMAKQKVDNPANFGLNCDRHCICEIPGQIPCPSIAQLPVPYRGKFVFQTPIE